MYAGDMTVYETLSASASAWNCRHNGIDCLNSSLY